MKRFIVIMLALLLMAPTAFASESEWRPEKPYAGLPAADFEKTLGYMMFYPNSGMVYEHNCRSLQIYLPRRDVQAGSATFYLCSVENGEELRFPFNDETHVRLRDMTEAERAALLWEDGVCFDIALDESLALTGSYFINMESDCIVTQDGKMGNVTIGGTDSWAFEVKAEYGYNNMAYRRLLPDTEDEYETLEQPVSGCELTFDLVLGGDAKMAALYCLNDSMEFETMMFTESVTVTGTVLTDEPVWGIVFLDENGNELWSENF